MSNPYPADLLEKQALSNMEMAPQSVTRILNVYEKYCVYLYVYMRTRCHLKWVLL